MTKIKYCKIFEYFNYKYLSCIFISTYISSSLYFRKALIIHKIKEGESTIHKK